MTLPPKQVIINCRYVILMLIMLLFSGVSEAQLLTPQVVNTNGFSKELANGYVTISVGESAIETLRGPTGIITQGFLQPETEPPCSDFELDYFPNPVVDFITIRDKACGRLINEIKVYDMLGNIVQEVRLVNREADLRLLGVGVFVVQGISLSGEVLGTFKIVKIKDQ